MSFLKPFIPYLLMTAVFLYLIYLVGKKTCKECPHPEKRLCFGTCKEMADRMHP